MNLNEKVFNLVCPNFMLNKTYRLSQTGNTTLILVSSPFVGNWEFEINSSILDYNTICLNLARYCNGELVQDCFPTLPPEQRENFITPPQMWENIYD